MTTLTAKPVYNAKVAFGPCTVARCPDPQGGDPHPTTGAPRRNRLAAFGLGGVACSVCYARVLRRHRRGLAASSTLAVGRPAKPDGRRSCDLCGVTGFCPLDGAKLDLEGMICRPCGRAIKAEARARDKAAAAAKARAGTPRVAVPLAELKRSAAEFRRVAWLWERVAAVRPSSLPRPEPGDGVPDWDEPWTRETTDAMVRLWKGGRWAAIANGAKAAATTNKSNGRVHEKRKGDAA